MSNLITLRSSEGEQLLSDVRCGKGFFQPILLDLFKKQIGDCNCGIQSSAMVLSACHLSALLPETKQGDQLTGLDAKYTEMALLDMPETRAVVNPEEIAQSSGIDLKTIHELLKAHGRRVSIVHASDVTEDDFRQQAKDALRRSNSAAAVIVNYHMSTLGQPAPYGHHSPLAGYHEETDRFLLLDVWKNTEPCWAKTSDLFRAMNTIDDASGKTRGYVIVKED